MPRKTRKSSQKVKAKPEMEDEVREEEKENQCTNLGPVELTVTDATSLPNKEEKPQFNKLFPQTEDVKPLGFWRRKLQDLEENETKDKMCRLYEFSGTDESDSSYRIKKKPKQKARVQKKRQATGTKFINPVKKTNKKESELKSKQLQRKTVTSQRVKLRQTDTHATEKGKKLTFSLGAKSSGITSTPAVKRDNLIKESDFLFLSPIIREEIDSESLPDGPSSEKLVPETPKLKQRQKRISCRRVLRSRKVTS